MPPIEFDAAPLPKIGPDPVVITETSPFFINAEKVLAYGRNEIKMLQSEKLPPVLEPGRSYLLRYLHFSLTVGELRFSYIKTGETKSLVEMLCQYCSCKSEANQKLVKELGEHSSIAARTKISLYSWYNTVLLCFNSQSGTYPVEVWKQFLQQYGIQETLRHKHID